MNSTHNKQPIENTSINIKSIVDEINEIDRWNENTKTLLPEQLLQELKTTTVKINFREELNLKHETERITRDDYAVTVVNKFLEHSEKTGYNFVFHRESIYIYNGYYWQTINQHHLRRTLKNVALKSGVNDRVAQVSTFINKLESQFFDSVHIQQKNQNDLLKIINFKNGTFVVDERKQYLRNFKKEDFLTYQLPYSYDEDAIEMPLFEKFLNEVLPNKESQKLLAEFLGFTLINNKILKLEKILILYGSGANGKGVVYEIVNALFGSENVSGKSLEDLTNGDGRSTSVLENCLLNFHTELGKKIDPSILKTLASGEKVKVKKLYKDEYTIENYARLMFSGNVLPSNIENTPGFFRRFILLPFNAQIPEHKKDTDLAKKIIDSELPAIFNWVLKGTRRLLGNKKFTKSQEVEDLILQYKNQADSTSVFIEENDYTPSDINKVKRTELYNSYKVFCAENGFKNPLSSRKFYTKLEDNNFRQIKTNGERYFFIQRKHSTSSIL